MTSIVNAAVSAIVAALQSGTPVAPQVARVRLRPIAQAATLAVVVRPLQAQVTQAALTTGYPVSWTTHIAVECYARSGASTTPDVAVDALIESVYTRLMADPTLGGAVIGLQPQDISFDFDADGEDAACATLVFHAYQRSTGTTFS